MNKGKEYRGKEGVPAFLCMEYAPKTRDYCVLIPVINEGERIIRLLARAKEHDIWRWADLVICDGGSVDNSMEEKKLRSLQVNTLLVKQGDGKQGAQLRMGFWWALKRGYRGIITIDGNDKDSIEDVPHFIQKLKDGFDFVQGSRFVKGGKAIHTPLGRYLAVRILHAPVISLTARRWYTDTTNAFRGYSRRYLVDKRVDVFRDIFSSYELLAYLSVRASQLKMRTCEIPVTRAYPKEGKIPTKISFFKGNIQLLIILFKNLLGRYNPSGKCKGSGR